MFLYGWAPTAPVAGSFHMDEQEIEVSYSQCAVCKQYLVCAGRGSPLLLTVISKALEAQV